MHAKAWRKCADKMDEKMKTCRRREMSSPDIQSGRARRRKAGERRQFLKRTEWSIERLKGKVSQQKEMKTSPDER